MFSNNQSDVTNRRRTPYLSFITATYTLYSIIFSGCGDGSKNPDDAVVIGVILPFSGEQAAVGLNIEQAIDLAVRDINDLGGIAGRSLIMESRDSNSGSTQGYAEAMSLLNDEKVKYLIGPEENAFAKSLVQDVKRRDITNLLPGYTAPIVRETGTKGAWIRLAPTPFEVGCAMAMKAIQDGHQTAVTIAVNDTSLLATNFNTLFVDKGGLSLGSVIIDPGEQSYLNQLEIISGLNADLVVLMAYPPTAAIIVQEWILSGNKGTWFLAPTLHTDVFLQNIPVDGLRDFIVFSPSKSPMRECEALDENKPNDLTCTQKSAHQFSEHYAETWRQDCPFHSAAFYYDAILLLALGLQYAAQKGEPTPSPVNLREYIKTVAESPGTPFSWLQINKALNAVARGTDIAYQGVAADYRFEARQRSNSYGAAIHDLIDTWAIEDGKFVKTSSIGLNCTE